MHKNCPFCGGNTLIIQTGTSDREGTPCCVMCDSCGACGPQTYTHIDSDGVIPEHAPFKEWNKRVEHKNPHDGSTLNEFLLQEKIDAWQKCAEDLVDYVHEFVAHLSAWGKGYDRNDREIKKAEDAIEKYYQLKK